MPHDTTPADASPDGLSVHNTKPWVPYAAEQMRSYLASREAQRAEREERWARHQEALSESTAAAPLPMLPGESDDAYTVRYMAHTKEKNRIKAATADALEKTKAMPLDGSDADRPAGVSMGGSYKCSSIIVDGHELATNFTVKQGDKIQVDKRDGVYSVTVTMGSCVIPAGTVSVYIVDEQTVPAEPTQAERRREIDALLREDARTTSAFATARRAAVLAAAEVFPEIRTLEAGQVIGRCHTYETLRGGKRAPNEAAADFRDIFKGMSRDEYVIGSIDAYERARGMR